MNFPFGSTILKNAWSDTSREYKPWEGGPTEIKPNKDERKVCAPANYPNYHRKVGHRETGWTMTFS